MENGGNRGQNGNNNTGPNLAWDIWDFGGTSSTTSSRFDHWNSTTNSTTTTSSTHHNNNINNHHHHNNTVTAYSDADTTTPHGSSGDHALMFPQHQHQQQQQQHYNYQQQQQQPPLLYGGGGGSHLRPDPHLMCLKLGKRQYFEDGNTVVTGGTTTTPPAAHLGDRHVSVMSEFSTIGKRGRPYYDGSVGVGFGVYGTSVVVPATVPRCQVEGCDVALVNAKEYHRRHKVCEMHSKAPKVVVLGLEQRFCQQCSRFHGISEFDESKRSCRRRLAGHNERRRKSSHDSNSLPKNSHSHNNNNNPFSQESKLMAGRYPFLASPTTDRALSLLSSKTDSWVSPPDLSSRSSAALRELIAENRAAILSRQLNIIDRDYWHWNSHSSDDQEENQQHHLMYHDQQPTGLDRYHEAAAAAAANGSYKTLDLMQAPPSSAFGLLSVRGKSSKDEECGDDQLWNSLEGANVV